MLLTHQSAVKTVKRLIVCSLLIAFIIMFSVFSVYADEQVLEASEQPATEIVTEVATDITEFVSEPVTETVTEIATEISTEISTEVATDEQFIKNNMSENDLLLSINVLLLLLIALSIVQIVL